MFLAREILNGVDQAICLHIIQLQTHMEHSLFQKTIADSNKAFEKLDNIEEYIDQKDREWVSSPKETQPFFMGKIISKELSLALQREFITFYEKNYGHKIFGEIIVTNKYGAVAAQTNKADRYRHNGEIWWLKAREEGLYTGDIKYNENVDLYGIEIGIRIQDDRENFMGVLKAFLVIKGIIRTKELDRKKYETTRIKLFTRNGKIIYGTRQVTPLKDLSGTPIFQKITGPEGFFIDGVEGQKRLYSYVRSKGNGEFKGLGWILVMGHDAKEVFAPVVRLRNNLIFASLTLVILGTIVFTLLIRSIVKSIVNLTRSTKIVGKGDLGHRIKVTTDDEIGTLATAFNQMLDKRQLAEKKLQDYQDHLEQLVKKRTHSLEKINKELAVEILDRRKKQERVLHLNAVLKALRSVNQLMISETDQDLLTQKACDILVANRGYNSAWIALFDENNKFVTAAEAGLNENFLLLKELLEAGGGIICDQRVLEQTGIRVIEDISSTCLSCPLADIYRESGLDLAGMRTRLKSGSRIFGIITVSMPRNLALDKEEQSLLLEVANDIAFALKNAETEKKRILTQAELARSEKKFRTLFEDSRDAIYINRKSGEFIDVNQAFLDLFGFTREEIFQVTILELFVNPEERAGIINQVEQKGFASDVQVKFCKKNGKKMDCLLSLSARWADDGSIKGFQGIIRDETRRKELEAQFLQAQKMESIGTLAGGVAHDFNNILSVIIGNSEIALGDTDRDDPVCEVLEEILKAGKRGAALTRQLLAFSRKQVIQPDIISMNTLIKNFEKMMVRMIGEDVFMEILLDQDLGHIMADIGQMEQVIMNLAVNAKDAMPMGGRFTIETANIDLVRNHFQSYGVKNPPGSFVMMTVKDTGIGMDKDIQKRIFEPFFTTKAKGRGTGLGLSTVYGIIKQNNGFIFVESELNKGTVFKIFLPITRGKKLEKRRTQIVSSNLNGSETILLVEDDDTLRKLTCKILKSRGYTVLDAFNGEDALKKSRMHIGSIHLMLTDIVMPGMSGSDLAEFVSALWPEMKLIYMSGYIDNPVVRQSVMDKEVEFLQKPFNLETLLIKVRQILDH